jgi:surface polysaccharide O-acyltransferase-like enzyme
LIKVKGIISTLNREQVGLYNGDHKTSKELDTRIHSIDTLKFVAVIGVVIFHGRPFYNISLPVSLLIRQVMICAVPILFLASGYLFRKKIMDGDSLSRRYLKTVKRLGFVLAAWNVIYLFIPGNPVMLSQVRQLGFFQGEKLVFNTKIHEIVDSPMNFIFAGTTMHLWFLVSLAMALTLLFLFIKLGIENKFLYLAVPLYVFQLLAGPYSITKFGIHIFTASYYGPFVSTLFVGIGALIARKDLRPSWQFAGWLILAGLAIQLGERLLLFTFFGRANESTGYVVGSVAFCTGFLLLALDTPSMGDKTGLSRLGKYVLGIYASHVIFLPVTQKYYDTLPKPLGETGPLAVLAASLLLTIILFRLPYVRRIVM